MTLESFYEKNYKKLITFSYLMLLVSIIILGVNYAKTGELFSRDISLKGGISVTIYDENLNLEEVKGLLKDNFRDYNVLELADFNTNKKIGLIIEVADITEPQLREVLKTRYDINFNDKNTYDSGLTNSSFGESFYRGLLIALLFSFILMSLFIFFSFKTFTPSLAVISATLIDILATLALLNILGVKISAAGIVAFLLIIGYSIDNNILLTTAMIKRREGKLLEFRVLFLLFWILVSIIAINPKFNAQGVAIKGIENNSTAALAGMTYDSSRTPTNLEKIIAINNEEVKNIQDYNNILSKIGNSEVIRVKTDKNEYVMIKTEDLGIDISEVQKNNLRKGLDLQGGTRVVLEPQEKLTDQEVQDLISTMENRLNVYGLSDLKIRQSKDLSGNTFIVVEIAGA